MGEGDSRRPARAVNWTLYGLANCDSCRKAARWLDARGVAYRRIDLRADGLPAGRLRDWEAALGPAALVNRRSTTWRGLSTAQRARADSGQAAALISEHPTLLKRPVLEGDGILLVGFDPANYARALAEGST